MCIIDGLAWLAMEIIKLFVKIGCIASIALVAAFFVGGFVAFLCHDGADEGGEEDADQQQAEGRTV